jgi:hypothetical protein
VKPINEEPLGCSMKNRFGNQDEIDCSFINSTFMILVNIAVLGILKLILFQLNKSPNHKKVTPASADDSHMINIADEKVIKTDDKNKSVIGKANDYFNLAFYVYFSNSLLLDIVMAGLVNLFFMGYETMLGIIHHVMSFSFICLFVGLAVKTIRIMIDYEKKKRDKVEGTHVKTKFKKWLFLRVPIKENAKLLPSFTPEAYMVHDILLCFFLVVFNGIAKI